MQILKIELPEGAAERLREEATRRNARVEEVAAKLLGGQLRYPIPEEFFTTDEEADFYANAVHQYRDEVRRTGK